MVELRELDAAKAILRETEPMQSLKRSHPDRYLRLEHLHAKHYFDGREVYGDNTREERRQQLAQCTYFMHVVL